MISSDVVTIHRDDERIVVVEHTLLGRFSNFQTEFIGMPSFLALCLFVCCLYVLSCA